MKKFVKDPLAHFLLAGLVLFFGLSLISEEDDFRTIVVDRETLLSFIQYRTKVFKPEVAAQRLDAMSESAREGLVKDFIEEEAMYREAKSLGLDGDDYVIRRRMVQKLEFINQGFAEQSVKVRPETLRAYFEANKDDYYIESAVTFTHVYLPFRDALSDTEEQQRARGLLQQLNHQSVPFSESVQYGERFPFHLNYVERTQDFVASHFGSTFAESIFSSSGVETDRWIGPVKSKYGLHLVRIKQRSMGRSPEYSEVEALVRQDQRMQWLRDEQQKAIDATVKQYSVVRHQL